MIWIGLGRCRKVYTVAAIQILHTLLVLLLFQIVYELLKAEPKFSRLILEPLFFSAVPVPRTCLLRW